MITSKAYELIVGSFIILTCLYIIGLGLLFLAFIISSIKDMFKED